MARIEDVAREAGVSIATVSYALSGKRAVAAATRRRIEEAAARLGYRPHAGARMLAEARTRILALTAPLRPDTYAPAHMAFVLGIAAAARRYDYDVLLLVEDDAMGGLERVTSSRLVDGIVVLDVAWDDERMGLVRSLGIPSVVVGVPRQPDGLLCVDLDFEAAARMAVDRLVDAGHRRLGLLGQVPEVYERGSGYPRRFRDAFVAHARARDVEAACEPSSTTPAGTRTTLDGLLAAGVTGLVLHSTEDAHAAVVDALLARGVRVPSEVSLISACSTFDTARFPVPLDAIPLVAGRSCDRAIDLLVGGLETPATPRVELLEPEYVSRGSAASPAVPTTAR